MAKTKEELTQLKEEYETIKTKLQELNDDELNKVTGGVIQAPNEKGVICNVAIGDIVNVSGYISGFNGAFCLVSINQYGAYKFVKYEKGAKYVEEAIRFTSIPKNVVITIIGHDDEFVKYNA